RHRIGLVRLRKPVLAQEVQQRALLVERKLRGCGNSRHVNVNDEPLEGRILSARPRVQVGADARESVFARDGEQPLGLVADVLRATQPEPVNPHGPTSRAWSMAASIRYSD